MIPGLGGDTTHRYVLVERRLFNGRQTLEAMTVADAALEVVAGAQNGVTVERLRVHWGAVLDNMVRSA